LGATYDNPILTDEEAYDVAAYINSFDRPKKPNAEVDYPLLTKKPVDSPYPPHPDDFSLEQHKYGPFQPIIKARQVQTQQ
jgi:thiosulfate dehydrogenase